MHQVISVDFFSSEPFECITFYKHLALSYIYVCVLFGKRWEHKEGAGSPMARDILLMLS